MIEVAGLSKTVGGTRGLDGIDLTVEDGEAVLLMGINGSGRTLLLEILATLVRPTGGSVAVDGIDVVRHPSQVRERIGFAAQRPEFHGRLTVSEHLEFTAAARDGSTSQRLAVTAALEPTTLDGGALIENLSHGEQQQLELTGALLGRPSVLLLDECLSQIDPMTRFRFLRPLKSSLARGACIVAACNAPNSLATLFRRVIVLHGGRIVGDLGLTGDLPDPETMFLDLLEGGDSRAF